VHGEREEAAPGAAQQPDQSAVTEAVWPTPGVRQAEVSGRDAASAHQLEEYQTAAADRQVYLQPAAPFARASGAGRVSASPQPGQRDEASRGAQDIEIHIGRIEVIAVAQQPQRAAPARTQRGETLEAYLKRHDRRSR
jgi:hypothetical protein